MTVLAYDPRSRTLIAAFTDDMHQPDQLKRPNLTVLDPAWLTASEAFPVTRATVLRWHRDLVARIASDIIKPAMLLS